MARILWRSFLWTAWSVPPTALFAVLYIVVLMPMWIGYDPKLIGNVSALALGALTASLLAPICIVPWVAAASVLPGIERSIWILCIGFVVWVCLLGEFATVYLYGDEPSLTHLVPFSLGAVAIASPRFFVPSLSVSAAPRVAAAH